MEIRLQLQGCLKSLDGIGVAAKLLQRSAEIGKQGCCCRADRECLFVLFDSGLESSGRVQSVAQIDDSVDIIRPCENGLL